MPRRAVAALAVVLTVSAACGPEPTPCLGPVGECAMTDSTVAGTWYHQGGTVGFVESCCRIESTGAVRCLERQSTGTTSDESGLLTSERLERLARDVEQTGIFDVEPGCYPPFGDNPAGAGSVLFLRWNGRLLSYGGGGHDEIGRASGFVTGAIDAAL